MGKAAMTATIIEGTLVSILSIIAFISMDMSIGIAFVLPVIVIMVVETCFSIAKGFKSIGLGVLNIIYCAKIGGILYLIWKPDPMTVVVEVPQVPEGLPEDNKVVGVTNTSVKVTVEIKQEEKPEQ